MAFPLRARLLIGLLLCLLWDQAAGRLAENCTEWDTKFSSQWLGPKVSDCRKPAPGGGYEGSNATDCCRLYLRLNGALRFFVARPPDGLGCAIREGEALFFAKLYFKNCAEFAATIQPPCPICGNAGIVPTPSGSVEPSPTPAGFLNVIPIASPVPSPVATPNGAITAFGDQPGDNATAPDAGNSPAPDAGNSPTTGGTTGSSGSTTGPGTAGSAAVSTPKPTSNSVCFHGTGLAQLRDGRFVRLDALRLSDEVLVGNGGYSTVFMFTHSSKEFAHFVNLTTSHGLSLAVTPGHLVHSTQGLVRAGDIQTGDSLLDQYGNLQRVASVEEFISTGIYNPHTLHGNIVVNGLTVSTYTTHVPIRAAHPLLSIFRSLWRATGWSTNLLRCGVPSASSVLGGACS